MTNVVKFPSSRWVNRADTYVPDVDQSEIVDIAFKRKQYAAFRAQIKFFRAQTAIMACESLLEGLQVKKSKKPERITMKTALRRLEKTGRTHK